jgi:hypothetical protein
MASIGSNMSNVISSISALIKFGNKKNGKLDFNETLFPDEKSVTVFDLISGAQRSILDVGKGVTELQRTIIMLLTDVHEKIQNDDTYYSKEFQGKVNELIKYYCPYLLK